MWLIGIIGGVGYALMLIGLGYAVLERKRWGVKACTLKVYIISLALSSAGERLIGLLSFWLVHVAPGEPIIEVVGYLVKLSDLLWWVTFIYLSVERVARVASAVVRGRDIRRWEGEMRRKWRVCI